MNRSIEHPSSRFVAIGLSGFLALMAAGCDRAKPPSNPTAASSGVPTGTSLPLAGSLPDLGLANVRTDVAAARGALITSGGGSISATGGNGAVYTLTLPAGAVSTPTRIGLYPVLSLATLPAGASLAAGVQFAPDGLQLAVPATLTISLPAGVDPAALTGLAWHGDDERAHAAPILVDGTIATLQVRHFSGDGVGEAPLEPVTACTTEDDLDQSLAGAAISPVADRRVAFLEALRACYRDYVGPQLQLSVDLAGTIATFADASYLAYKSAALDATNAYDAWLLGIEQAGARTHDASFTVSPELAASRTLAATFVRAQYDVDNNACKTSPLEADFRFNLGTIAMDSSWLIERWSLPATQANRLDLQSRLDDECIQVVIDPSRNFSALGPGTTGTVTVPVGYTLGGGVVLHDRNIKVEVNLTGLSHEFVALADAGDVFTQKLDWPRGVDPVRIDVLATILGNSFELTGITRFDRITKRAPRPMIWTFDSGLEGWRRGTAGPKGSANWGTVTWVDRNGGSISLDGVGGRGRPNSWISRTVTLPANATSLRYDVSPHDELGSDTHFRVRLLSGGVNHVLKDEVLHHTGPAGDLSFRTETLGLGAFAGQVVSIFFEQDDNGVGGSFPGANEQVYLDNIRVVTN
jgi:hypothetical protein